MFQLDPQANAYLKTRVMSAKPEELRLMLLDGAVRFARQGRDGIASGDFESMHTGFSQCRDIVAELLSTIAPDADPLLADRVRQVYGFIFRELMEVGFSRDLAKTDRIVELLEFERETWAMAVEKIAEDRRNGLIPDAGASHTELKNKPERVGVSLEA